MSSKGRYAIRVVTPEEWHTVIELYKSDPNVSVSEVARICKLRHEIVKQRLIDLEIYRGPMRGKHQLSKTIRNKQKGRFRDLYK
jgi:hypothetical protein